MALEFSRDLRRITAAARWAFARLALAAIAAVLVGGPAVAQARSAMPPLPDIQFVEIPTASRANYLGARFSYLEAGRVGAPVVLLLHGAGGNAEGWRYQLAGLSDRYRVIAWNAPGYFLTDGFVKDAPGCKDYAEAVVDFLAALKIDRVNIVGNSFGSRVAQCFGVHHPERIIKLALTGTGIGPKDMPADEKAKAIAIRQAQIANGTYQFAARAAELVGPNFSPEQMAELQRVTRALQPRGFLQGAGLGLANGYSPEEVGPRLTMPVLLIEGRVSKVNPGDKNAAVLVKVLKDGRLEWLENIGHVPEIEAPYTVNGMLREFFG